MNKLKQYSLPSREEENRQEALSWLWARSEKGKNDLQEARKSLARIVESDILEDLLKENYITTAGNDFKFTAKGNQEAQDVIRRNRLAERILTDILQIPEEQAAADACRMEHILSVGLSDAICTLLGHPQTCPHGTAIPRGKCCETSRAEISALMCSLDRLPVGSSGRVAYINSPDKPDTQRLLSMGLVPGTKIRLEQRTPAIVVMAGENTIAMETAVARGVFVRELSES